MMGATVIATSSSDEKLERMHLAPTIRSITSRMRIGAGEVLHPTTPAAWIMSSRSAAPVHCRTQSKPVVFGGHIALIGVLTGSSGPRSDSCPNATSPEASRLVVGSREQQIECCGSAPSMRISSSRLSIERFRRPRSGDAFRYEESGAHVGKICIEI